MDNDDKLYILKLILLSLKKLIEYIVKIKTMNNSEWNVKALQDFHS